MTATDELRLMLDERGIKWWEADDERKTLWESNGLTWEYFNDENGDAWLGFLGACEQDITPEQAIAATLGSEDTYTREDVESAFVSGYSLGCLPAGSDPTWDQNEQTIDEHMAEWGWVREESATLCDSDATRERQGVGTCHSTTSDNAWCFACSECGKSFPRNQLHLAHNHGEIKFCPNCGRRVVE